MKKFIDEYKALIPKNLDGALDAISSNLSKSSPSYNEIIQFKSQYEDIEKDRRHGTQNDGELSIRLNKLRSGLTSFLDTLQDSDLLETIYSEGNKTKNKLIRKKNKTANSTIRNRIWHELVSARHCMEYLGLHIIEIDTKNKWIEYILLCLSFIGIIGWYIKADYSVFWAFFLIAITVAKFMKSKFMLPESEISALKSSYEFYIDYNRSLEKLWYDLKEQKYNDLQAQELYENCIDSERLMMKINKHDKVIHKEPIKSIADKATRNYLTKFS